MPKIIKNNISILCTLFFFIISVAFFVISTTATAHSFSGNDCYHCGSVSACEDGGQPYGFDGCTIHPDKLGTPEGCEIIGGPCGGDEN